MSKVTKDQQESKMVVCKMNNGGCDEAPGSASKLSKIGRRIRDSCRQHLRGKHPSGGASSNPEDYGSTPAPNESGRSLHYVPMDFTGGKSGRIISAKDMPGQSTKDGYTFYRRPIYEPQNVDHLLTETQANIHKRQPWFHKGVGRDLAQKILGSHSVDGLFLVRESSVQGGFVISYYFNGRAYHAPVMPFTHPTTSAITYSLDDGKTKFYDLLQLVEFYQLNKGTLCAKLSHFVINKPIVATESSHLRSESPESNSSCKHANSDVSLDSSKNAEEGASSSSSSASNSATDNNHNSKAKASTMETSEEEESVTNNQLLDNEAPMPSEDEEN